ncbi:MAG: pantothenate kinase [Bacteroidetes bacterium HGW-Bacteroidetes-8]|jgi:type II pantothenate kinase|nr:MAG: pantothenate kinase [Bacteroidetes bacterium HGW-Bacteroidetes-8]
MIIGIDIGSTTTKAVAVESGEVIRTVKTKAYDAITSATGALGKIIVESNLSMSSIEKIIITGAGAINIKNNLFGIPTKKIDEINAIGIGGMFLSKKESVIIANIGTGTSIIEATKEKITHLGGTGVGGGTIAGLSRVLLNATDFEHILEMAGRGDISKVDLLIEDISDSGISFLSGKSTASNFGKMLDTAERDDMAIGIINLVFQVIGVISVFAAKSREATSVMVTGNGSKNLIGRAILEDISRLYNIRFEFPQDAEYATAIGAALSES